MMDVSASFVLSCDGDTILGRYTGGEAAECAPPPAKGRVACGSGPWLTPRLLVVRQGCVRARVDELRGTGGGSADEGGKRREAHHLVIKRYVQLCADVVCPGCWAPAGPSEPSVYILNLCLY
eukprot:SAG25_NODE_2_length_31535_cov_18.197322_5_plen_122_part_00